LGLWQPSQNTSSLGRVGETQSRVNPSNPYFNSMENKLDLFGNDISLDFRDKDHFYSVWHSSKTKSRKLGLEEVDLPEIQHKNRYIGFKDRKNKPVQLSTFSSYRADTIIKKYSKEGDLILDPFCGRFTRCYYTIINNRKYIGFDIQPEVISNNREVLNNHKEKDNRFNEANFVYGDGCELNFDTMVDFIFTCPPYLDLEYYGDEPNQLANMSYTNFLNKIGQCFINCYNLLKPNKYCCFVIGDVRKNGELLPLHSDFIVLAKKAGFKLFDTIILVNDTSMNKALIWTFVNKGHNFTGKIHEYLLVFKKEVD
jgi:DNA modification methylase